jgi:U3 small nucleolar RNA-associated protein 22
MTEITSKMSKNHNIIIPFPVPRPTDDIKYKFGFKKPSAFYLIGSFNLKTVVRGKDGFNVDVAVIMPQVIFSTFIYSTFKRYIQKIKKYFFFNSYAKCIMMAFYFLSLVIVSGERSYEL